MYCSTCGKGISPAPAICSKCGVNISTDVVEMKESLRKTILDAYYNEYKDAADNWRSTDTKAQGNIAIAGIFLAGIFAYIEKLTPNLTGLEAALIISATVCLGITLVLSLLALIIREVPNPPLGGCADHNGTFLLAKDDEEFLRKIPRAFNEQLLAWRGHMKTTGAAYKNKADCLFAAQCFIFSTTLLVAILIILKAVR